MKSQITLMMLAGGLTFVFFACSAEIPEDPGPQARLLSLTVTTPSGNIAVSVIPEPIPSGDWNNEEYEVTTADFGTIPVKEASDTESVRINPVVSSGAVVRWGKARAGNRPDYFDDPRVTASFTNDDFLYFKVTADDGETVNYYRFYSIIASPVKEMVDIFIAGRETDKVPQPAASLETLAANIGSTAFRGQIDITRREAGGSTVAAVPQDATAKIRYAVASNAAAAQANNFGSWVNTAVVVVKDEQEKDISQAHSNMSFSDGNILAVEVTAQNGVDVNYYGFMVTAGRMATIAMLSFDGEEVVGKGTQQAQWASVTPGSFSSADQRAAGFNITIDLDDPQGSYDYAVISGVNAAQPSSFSTSSAVPFTDGQALAIRVQSPRGNASDTRYYKVQVNLLAANFTEQPKSAVYYITSHTYQPAVASGQPHNGRILIDSVGDRTLDRAIEPLTFSVDRAEGGFSYQWYTANSWYGGYGFDKDGRIGGDPGTILDAYHPSAESRDEKGNVSLHNGGNEFYRLPYEGNLISGATSNTYTPTIDASRRPFITGFSNQTQYYWVIITDSSGRKVTSKRAAIVTEWGEIFEEGKPQGTKVDKKHHIVNLHAYLDESGNTPGLQDNPRNTIPFKAGNHGDLYNIPMTFPDGFNIRDYSVVTCQAWFFLADGRAWIQNWTQGDFGFANENETKEVLWYNLTNDNATRGLSGSGNEPQGSGLDIIPSYLVVQPAGTTPIKQVPPFRPDGQPDREAIEADGKSAQGWFTPYIEIVELRFEGPSR